MKKTGKILCIILVAILIVIMIISNNTNANTLNLETASSSVESGNTFTVTMKLGEEVQFINFKMTFDSNLFEFIDNESGWNTNNNDGTIACMYADQNNNMTDKCVFKFKAKDVTEEKSGEFKIVNDNDNDIHIVAADNTEQYGYDLSGGNFSISINVKPKSVTPTPTPTPITDKPVLSDNNVSLNIGETKDVSITNGVNGTWTSSDPNVATVDQNGKITAVAEGQATITVSNDGGSATVNVIVGAPAPVPTPGDLNGPALNKDNVNIQVGGSDTVTADRNVTWTSSDTNVATVDQNGKITGIGKGTAVITATDENGNKSYVTVIVSVVSTPSDGSGSENGSGSGSGTSSGSGSGTVSSNTGNSVSTSSSSSSANEAVPATGESSVGTIIILVVVTLIVASIIFKRKSKVK